VLGWRWSVRLGDGLCRGGMALLVGTKRGLRRSGLSGKGGCCLVGMSPVSHPVPCSLEDADAIVGPSPVRSLRKLWRGPGPPPTTVMLGAWPSRIRPLQNATRVARSEKKKAISFLVVGGGVADLCGVASLRGGDHWDAFFLLLCYVLAGRSGSKMLCAGGAALLKSVGKPKRPGLRWAFSGFPWEWRATVSGRCVY